MNTHEDSVAPGRTRDGRSPAVVSALVEGGLIDAQRSDEALDLVDAALSDRTLAASEHPTTGPLRRRFAEVAGYVGGAFVVAAAGLFFFDQWGGLSHGERVALLAGITVLLAAAGVGLALSGGGFHVLRSGLQAVRRRLAGVLFTGAAVAAAFAVSLQVEHVAGGENSAPVMAGALVVLVVALLGYLAAPTVVGQLAVAAGAFLCVPSGLDLGGDVKEVPFGLLVLALGVSWQFLAEAHVWREVDSARIIGSVLAVMGAQIPIGGPAWVAYAATAAVAVAAFAAYVVRPEWPYLATGVVGVTLAVPEALTDWTDGSLGSAGVLLVTGVTLLVASVLGLRLRKEVAEQPAG